MDNRLVAVAAVVLVAGAAGCSSKPAALGGATAKVTINGQSTGGPHPVRCTQSGWLWRIESANQNKGFTADLGTGDQIAVQSVDFRDFGGFTGTYWEGHRGEAEVTSKGSTYTITGSADGAFAADPIQEVTTTFRIEASC